MEKDEIIEEIQICSKIECRNWHIFATFNENCAYCPDLKIKKIKIRYNYSEVVSK